MTVSNNDISKAKPYSNIRYDIFYQVYVDTETHADCEGLYVEGTTFYHFHKGYIHRIDGPAVYSPNRFSRYYYRGERKPYKEWVGLVWKELTDEQRKQFIYGGDRL